MNPQVIRTLDVWAGKPLCCALTVWRQTARPFTHIARFLKRDGGRGAPPPIRKILFIKMIEQGATVLAHGAVARAVQLVGRENVYFWVFKENRAILDLLALTRPENVFEVRTDSLFRCGLDLVRTLWRIRRMKIDATVDMEFFARASAALAFLTGARRRVGLHRFTTEGPYRGDLLTHRVEHNPYLHTSLAYGVLVESLLSDPCDLPLLKRPARALGFGGGSNTGSSAPAAPIDYLGPPPQFLPNPAEIKSVQDTLDRLAGREVNRPIVLLNPNASDMLPLRKWPTERFIDLGARLLAEAPDATLVITGAPDECGVARQISRQIVERFKSINASSANDDDARAAIIRSDDNAPAMADDRPVAAKPRQAPALISSGAPRDAEQRCISIAGETTMRDLLVLYTMSDVLVTNDSGPGHFAAMTEIDSVVLFGPETPALFGPIGKHSHVLWAGLACSPCVNAMNHRFSPCSNNVCMQEISVEQVLAVVTSVLRRRAGGTASEMLAGDSAGSGNSRNSTGHTAERRQGPITPIQLNVLPILEFVASPRDGSPRRSGALQQIAAPHVQQRETRDIMKSKSPEGEAVRELRNLHITQQPHGISQQETTADGAPVERNESG